MAERVKFAGDPVPMETGSGQGPQIPLDKNVRPTTVEMIPQGDDEDKDEKPTKKSKASKPSDDDDDEEEAEEAAAPTYNRERIGARIGEPLEAAKATDQTEQQLDADDVVPCMFQTAVHLQDAGLMHHWAPGVHLVPVSIAGRTMKERHWWLKQNKVRHVGAVQKNPDADNRTAQEVEEA